MKTFIALAALCVASVLVLPTVSLAAPVAPTALVQ
jgi:hypothetical protein